MEIKKRIREFKWYRWGRGEGLLWGYGAGNDMVWTRCVMTGMCVFFVCFV